MNGVAPNSPKEDKPIGVAKQVLNRLRQHHHLCFRFSCQPLAQAVRRPLERFLRVEQKAIFSLANFLMKEDLKQDFLNLEKAKLQAEVASPVVLLQENQRLMNGLKQSLSRIHEPQLLRLLSYWLAALQIEHDELAQHILAD